jgi:hypothetical protein
MSCSIDCLRRRMVGGLHFGEVRPRVLELDWVVVVGGVGVFRMECQNRWLRRLRWLSPCLWSVNWSCRVCLEFVALGLRGQNQGLESLRYTFAARCFRGERGFGGCRGRFWRIFSPILAYFHHVGGAFRKDSYLDAKDAGNSLSQAA